MPETLPSYFIGHGNPMNAVLTNTYTEQWTRIGRETPRPASHFQSPGTGSRATARTSVSWQVR